MGQAVPGCWSPVLSGHRGPGRGRHAHGHWPGRRQWGPASALPRGTAGNLGWPGGSQPLPLPGTTHGPSCGASLLQFPRPSHGSAPPTSRGPSPDTVSSVPRPRRCTPSPCPRAPGAAFPAPRRRLRARAPALQPRRPGAPKPCCAPAPRSPGTPAPPYPDAPVLRPGPAVPRRPKPRPRRAPARRPPPPRRCRRRCCARCPC